MSRYLLLDVGAGTLDVLYYDGLSREHFKAVVKSPVRTIAEKAAALGKKIVATGVEMGGGDLSGVLQAKAQEYRVLMTEAAAATIHHDLDRVRSFGIEIVDEQEAEDAVKSGNYSRLTLGDLEPDRLKKIVKGFGVPFVFDVVGICAQDHGVPPPGRSHLDYRHDLFKRVLGTHPRPHALLYEQSEVPETLNRLRSIAQSANNALPASEIYVMDSGMAAMIGALSDSQVLGKDPVMVLDIATSHTLGAVFSGEELAAFFEYHTRDITLPCLETLLPDLAEGKVEHKKILEQGGHGAYTRKSVGYANVEIILATGPRRSLLKGTTLPVVFGAPGGDNMMTGTLGLLEAIGRRKGLAPALV
jgi:uncharacterized protein (DUF1786 family)